MSPKTRMLQIEAKMDTLDPDSAEYAALDAEANAIADELNQVEEAYARAAKERELAQRMARFKERVTINSGNYDDWMDWAETLYPITEENGVFMVRSKAANWKETKEWPCEALVDALERREELVGYKAYDRKRGRGSVADDLASVDLDIVDEEMSERRSVANCT